jgi:prepilin-type N-terminal cleavage/methylation domain-containing protein
MNNFKKRNSNKAFTLIEVLVSVIIVSIVVVGALKLQGQNSNMATYLLKRGNAELDNSLFLTDRVQRYDKSKKNAYDILVDEFQIKDDESRQLLKKIEKKINITEAEPIPVGETEDSPALFTFYSNEILLNGKYPARYYTFK